MRKFHSIAALCGDGLRPELRELFDRLAVDPHSEVFVRPDGMVQSGPDPKDKTGEKRSRDGTEVTRLVAEAKGEEQRKTADHDAGPSIRATRPRF
jgi:hypothetical protein